MSASPSLARRYTFKLLTNVFTVPMYLVMEAILPRALGPAAYGAFSYVTGMFQYLVNFLDGGTSSCLYMLLARGHDWCVAVFYRNFALLLLGVTLALAFLGALPAADAFLMPDIPRWTLPYAALWAYLSWGARVLRGVSDALGNTVSSEKARMLASVVAIGVLIVLYVARALTLLTLFWQQLLYYGMMAAGFLYVVWRGWEGGRRSLSRQEKTVCRRRFFSFSAPIFASGIITAVALMAERWLLQYFDGNVQQGFFGLSQKVGMACFLCISAMIPLVMREFSIAFDRRDLSLMASQYDRFGPMLFSVGAYFTCFVALEAPVIVRLFGGAEFLGAVGAVQVMSFYPVHQGYGQLTTSAFYAADRTRSILWVTVIVNLLGLVLAWVTIAPPEQGGLNLGALGLACKTVITQIVSVTIMIWLLSRIIPIRFWRTLLHQCASLGVMGALAFVCVWGGRHGGWGNMIAGFITQGFVYTLLAGCALLAWPGLFGLSRKDLARATALARALWTRLTRKGQDGA